MLRQFVYPANVEQEEVRKLGLDPDSIPHYKPDMV